MPILGASFQIGRSALAAYQAALAVTGQNIANVGNPDYTRQSGRLEALYGGLAGSIAPGTGVNLTGLQRHVDQALESRLRLALGTRSGAELTYGTLNRVEALYNELSGQDLSTELTSFFGQFAALETDPQDNAARNLLVSQADALIRTLQRNRSGILTEVGSLNDSVRQMTTHANGIVAEVARLNGLIATAEGRGIGTSGALRDRRDALLRELGELMDIQTREQDNGTVNVYAGSEPLVDFNRSRGLKVEAVLADGRERLKVRFADNNGPVTIRDGKLGAAIAARDTHLAGQLTRLDRLAQGLIYEVNRVHSGGQGLVGYTAHLGAYAVRNADAALNSASAGLAFPVQNGTFVVRMKDQASGQVTSHLIEVDLDGLNGNDTTLSTLVRQLGAVTGLTATATADGRVQLAARAGYEIGFAEDSSGALAALGLANFFEGSSADTIAVAGAIRNDPRLIASSLSGAPNDGANAGRLALLGTQVSALLGGVGIEAYHQNTVSALATTTAAAQSTHEAADAVYSSLLAQREATSGVNLDEEAINLTKFERSFQGASRFLNVIDQLAGEIIALLD